ncbi:hypothetical protein, partial [Butyrivibrio fibrisolvens]|uniref:hypothetical protein n=1 Tax=Butyrivibrio fibrisolvens TaxID=831 RepID=UPI00040A2FD7
MDDFSYNGFQVVRGNFFAHLFEPSVTFKAEKVYVNAACIRKLPTVEYVQFLVLPDKKMLAIKPCSEDTQDSFRWCSQAPTISKRKAKPITCRVFFAKVFFAKVFSLMKRNPEFRYKVLGKLVCTSSDKLFVFDLSTAKAFRHKNADDTSTPQNVPLFPNFWADSFGIPISEHDNNFNLNIFDEDAVFTIEKDLEKPEKIGTAVSEDTNPLS